MVTEKDIASIINDKDPKFKDKLRKIYKEKDDNLIFIYLLLNIYSQIKGLKYYYENTNLMSIFDLINLLINTIGNNSNFTIYANKIFLISDKTSLNKEDIEYINTTDNNMLKEFIKLKFKNQIIEKQIKPKWISKKEDENITLLETTPTGYGDEDINVKYKEIYDKMFELEGEEDMESNIKGFNVKDCLFIYLNNVLDYKGEDQTKLKQTIKEFRVWGPINRSPTDCCSSPGGKGPCRMLYCCCNEESVDTEYRDYVDWFTGECDKCEREITNKSYALRIPLVGGGWSGCFCSKKCMEDYYDVEDLKEKYLIEKFINDIYEIGIMDRNI